MGCLAVAIVLVLATVLRRVPRALSSILRGRFRLLEKATPVCRPPVAQTTRIHRISAILNRLLPPHLEIAQVALFSSACSLAEVGRTHRNSAGSAYPPTFKTQSPNAP